MAGISHLIPWTLLVLLALGWLYRERSLSSILQVKEARITELQEYNQVLLLQLQIEADTKKSLFQWIDEEVWNQTSTLDEVNVTTDGTEVTVPRNSIELLNSSSLAKQCQQFNNTNNLVLQMIQNVSQHYIPILDTSTTQTKDNTFVFFDLAGITYLSIVFSAIMYEYYSIYGFSIDIDTEANQMDKEIFWRTRTFLAKHHPLTNIVFFLVLIILGSLSWMGIFFTNRTAMAYLLLKLSLSYGLATMLSYVASNFLRLIKYLPADRDSWIKSVQDLTWWHWCLSRCFGVYDLTNGLSTLLWLAAVIWYIWPVRYFFYYLQISFTVNDALAVFVLNSVVQTAIVLVIVYYFYCVSILMPLIIGMKQMPESEEDLKQRNIINRIVYQWIKSFLENQFLSLLQYGHSDKSMAILIFVSIVNSLLYAFRVLYFLYTNKCTWYAWCITWMWLHVHIGLSVFALPCINFLMQEVKLQQRTKTSFMDQFVNVAKEKIAEEIKLAKQKQGDESAAEEEMELDEEALRKAASDIFDTSLSKSVLFCLFVDTKKDENEDKKAKKEGEEEESRLAVIFTSMLQTEAYAMGMKYANQENADNSESTDYTPQDSKTKSTPPKAKEDDGFVLEEVD